MRSGARDINLRILPNGGIFWGWADTGLKRPAGLTARETRQAFNDVADTVRTEIASRFPRKYSFSGLKSGHSRRYARDMEQRLAGSGYRGRRLHDPWFDQDAFILDPTPQAYLDYLLPRASGALNAGLVGGGVAYGIADANR